MDEIPVAPNEQCLREAALVHVARFATTQQGLRQMLQRRVRRWAMHAQKAGALKEEVAAQEASLLPVIERIIEAMGQIGAVDDVGFALSKARSLTRSGRSRRAVMAQLVMKGVDRETAGRAVTESLGYFSDEEGQAAELAAALVLARRRSVGPFQRSDRPEEERPKILALFARNGFSQDIACKALEMEREAAEDHIIAFRSR